MDLQMPILLITCRKLKPKCPEEYWCRSCALNLKKRCGGLQLPPGEPPRPEQYGAAPTSSPSIKKKKKSDVWSAKKSSTDAQGLSADGKRSESRPRSNDNNRGVSRRFAASEATRKIQAPLQRLPPARRVIVPVEGSDDDSGESASDESDSDDGLTEEKWAQCEKCDKWRKLPNEIDLNELPKKWFCHMNKWDPGQNRCTQPEATYDARTAATSKHEPVTQKAVFAPQHCSGSAGAATLKGSHIAHALSHSVDDHRTAVAAALPPASSKSREASGKGLCTGWGGHARGENNTHPIIESSQEITQNAAAEEGNEFEEEEGAGVELGEGHGTGKEFDDSAADNPEELSAPQEQRPQRRRSRQRSPRDDQGSKRLAASGSSAPWPSSSSSASSSTSWALAEALGLKTVEAIKGLCRGHAIRTTRAGTNGGRKSKAELIDNLLATGCADLAHLERQMSSSSSSSSQEHCPANIRNDDFPTETHKSVNSCATGGCFAYRGCGGSSSGGNDSVSGGSGGGDGDDCITRRGRAAPRPRSWSEGVSVASSALLSPLANTPSSSFSFLNSSHGGTKSSGGGGGGGKRCWGSSVSGVDEKGGGQNRKHGSSCKGSGSSGSSGSSCSGGSEAWHGGGQDRHLYHTSSYHSLDDGDYSGGSCCGGGDGGGGGVGRFADDDSKGGRQKRPWLPGGSGTDADYCYGSNGQFGNYGNYGNTDDDCGSDHHGDKEACGGGGNWISSSSSTGEQQQQQQQQRRKRFNEERASPGGGGKGKAGPDEGGEDSANCLSADSCAWSLPSKAGRHSASPTVPVHHRQPSYLTSSLKGHTREAMPPPPAVVPSASSAAASSSASKKGEGAGGGGGDGSEGGGVGEVRPWSSLVHGQPHEAFPSSCAVVPSSPLLAAAVHLERSSAASASAAASFSCHQHERRLPHHQFHSHAPAFPSSSFTQDDWGPPPPNRWRDDDGNSGLSSGSSGGSSDGGQGGSGLAFSPCALDKLADVACQQLSARFQPLPSSSSFPPFSGCGPSSLPATSSPSSSSSSSSSLSLPAASNLGSATDEASPLPSATTTRGAGDYKDEEVAALGDGGGGRVHSATPAVSSYAASRTEETGEEEEEEEEEVQLATATSKTVQEEAMWSQMKTGDIEQSRGESSAKTNGSIETTDSAAASTAGSTAVAHAAAAAAVKGALQQPQPSNRCLVSAEHSEGFGGGGLEVQLASSSPSFPEATSPVRMIAEVPNGTQHIKSTNGSAGAAVVTPLSGLQPRAAASPLFAQ